jgi:hypothetical protein
MTLRTSSPAAMPTAKKPTKTSSHIGPTEIAVHARSDADRRRYRHLVLAVIGTAGIAAAGVASQTAVTTLAQTGEMSCQPSQPFFCENMHVSCSGQTSMETFAFKLRATRTRGSIEVAAEHELMRKLYENGSAEWDREGTYVILFPRPESGYIKLASDGTYSFRHYTQQGGVMAIGHCK